MENRLTINTVAELVAVRQAHWIEEMESWSTLRQAQGEVCDSV